MEKKKERVVSLDIVRIFALVCVVTCHFFLHNNYYYTAMHGKRMFAMTLIRCAATVNVPLFIMLTGYLMNKKTLSKKYYKGIIKTLGIYLIASVICLLYKKFYLQMPEVNLLYSISQIFSFSAANYSWYVEMYIGLFLMIPFLNLSYHHLESKKQKQALIATFIFVTSACTIANVYYLKDFHWFLDPASNGAYTKIVPDWWRLSYPLTYYFIGCYLSEYRLPISKKINLLLYGISVLFFAIFNFWHSHNANYSWGIWQNSESILVLIPTVLIFQFITSFEFQKLSAKIKSFLAKLSDLVFGAYLISYIFDDLIITKINNIEPDVLHRLEYIVIEVPLVLLCSFIVSYVMEKIYLLVMWLTGMIKQKLFQKQES